MSLGLSPTDINNTFSVAWGSAYVDNFMDRNRVKRFTFKVKQRTV